jgi:CBS domain-containing protein
MVTKLDLLRMVRPERFRWIPDFQLPWARCADDVMSRRVVSLAPDERVADAIDRMVEHGLRSLPVVERRGDQRILVGIVTRKDCLAGLAFAPCSHE